MKVKDLIKETRIIKRFKDSEKHKNIIETIKTQMKVAKELDPETELNQAHIDKLNEIKQKLGVKNG